ncbi:MAG: DUF2298 domain-containing protein [Natronomonas sp.]
MEYGFVVLWLVASLLVGIAALPLAGALFRQFPDRGAALSIPVGLSTIAVVGYLVGHVVFGGIALVSGVLVLLGASYRFGTIEGVEWRTALEAALVFAAAFLLIVIVRGSNPEIAPLPISPGEKFLDFGLLRSLLRTGSLPPNDMWFAGSPVRYYYGGHLLTSLLTIGTATKPAIAYNLALAVFYGALVVGTYGLAGAIAADMDANRRLAGGLAAFFVGIAANLHTGVALLLWALPNRLLHTVGNLSADHPFLEWTPDRFFYWDASRIIDGTINEFPLFAWLNGDLHAHMMSTPFLVLVAACCFAYWQTPEAERSRRIALLGVLTPLVGWLAVTNTWSFPTSGGLIALTVAFAPADPATLLPSNSFSPRRTRSTILEEIRRDGLALGVAVAVLVVGGLWVVPFWVESASSQGMGIFPDRSGLSGLLLVHGGFLFAFGWYLGTRLGVELVDPVRMGGLGVAWILALFVTTRAGVPVLGLFGPVLIGGWWVLRHRVDVGFETVLIVAGIGLVTIVEFVYVVDPGAPGRLNTVFKVYMQTWVIWAVAIGVVLARLVDPSAARDALDTRNLRILGIGLVFGLLIVTGSYAAFAVPAHVGSDPVGTEEPTLDGKAYLESSYPDEAAAIQWLDDRSGTPTIVTAAPGGYHWDPDAGEGASAPASLTGLPTVLGWHHEEQYRGTTPYTERLADVTAIYEGSRDEQTGLLDSYDVRYVYVGPAERARYDLTIEDHPSVRPVFQEGSVVVYEYRNDSSERG